MKSSERAVWMGTACERPGGVALLRLLSGQPMEADVSETWMHTVRVT